MKYEYVYELVKEAHEEFLDLKAFPEIVCAIEPADHEKGQIDEIAYDAIINALQARMDYDDDIPKSDASEDPKNENIIRISTMDTMKLALYQEYLSRKLPRSTFAKMVDATPTSIARVFDLHHSSKAEVLQGMFRKLGVSVSTDITTRLRA